MRILTQDRKGIIFTENVDTICMKGCGDHFHLFSFNGDDESKSVLGSFKTEQKAADVIEEIFRSDLERFIIPKDVGEDDED